MPCPGPLGSRSPVCPLRVLCCVCAVLGHLAPVHRFARSVCCVACAVSLAIWLLFTGVPAGCFVLCCVCGVLDHMAPVHWSGCSLLSFACALSLATWLLFTGVPARCVVLRVRCPGPLGSCSPVPPPSALICLCGVLDPLAPVHRCACSVCSVACAVSLATWLLFTGAPARCVVLRVRCPGPLGSCSPVCPLGVLCCVCGVLGHLAPIHRSARSVSCVACAVSCATWIVHRCAPSVCCVACAASWATWLLSTGMPTRCVVLRVRCPGPLGSCSPVCPLSVLCCVCGVLGHLAPVHQRAHSVCCVACAVSSDTWLLFTGLLAWCAVLRVRCPGPPGSCSPVCPLGVLCCVCGVLGHLTPVHRCGRSVFCFVCAVSWATWLLLTSVLAQCVVLRARCRGTLGSCSPVCSLCARCCVCSVLGHLARVRGCARSMCCVVLGVRCPGRLGSRSPVCSLGVLRLVFGVLNHLAPVHRCARSVYYAVGCVCGAWLRGAYSSIRIATIRSRQGLGTLQARTRPSRRRLFRSRQGLGTLRAHTRPSGRRLFRSRQGLCLLPGAHSSLQTAAGIAWHRFSCRGSLRAVRALGVCGTLRPLLLGTCPCALVVAGGVPLRRASWPRLVRRASSGPVAPGAPVCFLDAVVPFPTPGACAPSFSGWLRGTREGRPKTGLIVPAAGPRRGGGAGLAPRRTRSGPRDGVVPGGSLRRRSWAACAAVVGVCGPGQ